MRSKLFGNNVIPVRFAINDFSAVKIRKIANDNLPITIMKILMENAQLIVQSMKLLKLEN